MLRTSKKKSDDLSKYTVKSNISTHNYKPFLRKIWIKGKTDFIIIGRMKMIQRYGVE